MLKIRRISSRLLCKSISEIVSLFISSILTHSPSMHWKSIWVCHIRASIIKILIPTNEKISDSERTKNQLRLLKQKQFSNSIRCRRQLNLALRNEQCPEWNEQQLPSQLKFYMWRIKTKWKFSLVVRFTCEQKGTVGQRNVMVKPLESPKGKEYSLAKCFLLSCIEWLKDCPQS